MTGGAGRENGQRCSGVIVAMAGGVMRHNRRGGSPFFGRVFRGFHRYGGLVEVGPAIFRRESHRTTVVVVSVYQFPDPHVSPA